MTDPIAYLGPRLKEIRMKTGLSLREIARQLNVSPSFVSQIENGKSQPSVATLYALAKLLSVPVDVLFESAGNPVAAPTKSIFRNNTLSKTKLNTSHLAAGTLSITKHPPGVHQGIGEHHPNIANSRPKIHAKPIPKIQPISKEQE
jgi:transcriptional regulator with XRE-family HTH domain